VLNVLFAAVFPAVSFAAALPPKVQGCDAT